VVQVTLRTQLVVDTFQSLPFSCYFSVYEQNWLLHMEPLHIINTCNLLLYWMEFLCYQQCPFSHSEFCESDFTMISWQGRDSCCADPAAEVFSATFGYCSFHLRHSVNAQTEFSLINA